MKLFLFIFSFLIEKVKKSTMVVAADFAAFTTTYAKDYKFRVCGLGATDNKGTKPKGLLCAELNVIDGAACKTALGDTTMIPEDGTAICLTSLTDANVCAGDYGGPIWATKYSTDGKTLTDQLLVGVTVGSPNIRSNAPCLGGQTIGAMFTPDMGVNGKWIAGVIAERVVPAE
jgi:hypothetical protein